MRKKKGFTLIEVLTVISIILIFIFSGDFCVNAYGKMLNSLDVSYCSNSITGFILNAKLYCRKNDVSGCMFFDIEKNKIILSSNMKLINEYIMPKGFKLLSVNAPSKFIYINNKGIVENACTIRYRDRRDSYHRITICVGSGYVEIKE